MRSPNPLPGLIFLIIFIASLALAYASMGPESYVASVAIAVVGFIIASLLANAVKVADQWERVVVLRLGKFRGLEGPGLFFIVPILETVAYRIDTRVITSTFRAEQTMTRDTVPVDVDAVLFFKVVDPKTAALDVADYGSAINWAAQTALRDVIGKTLLADMLEGREKLSVELQRIIDARAKPWGIDVIAVELKDVRIPAALQDAMSMQAQAERERQARVILGDSERQVAEFVQRRGEGLRRQSDRLSPARDEHALRGLKAQQRDHRHRALDRGRIDAARGHADDGDGRQRHRPGAGQWRGRAGGGRRAADWNTHFGERTSPFPAGSPAMRDTDTNFAGSIPDLYDDYLVPLLFEPYASDLARRTASTGPARVLETAAGTGVVARALIPASRLARSLCGQTDLNQPMLDRAASRQGPTGASSGDWRTLSSCRSRRQLRHGSLSVRPMFFPDRIAGYRRGATRAQTRRLVSVQCLGPASRRTVRRCRDGRAGKQCFPLTRALPRPHAARLHMSGG